MASMVQLDLFDAARQNLRALHIALERIKPGRASKQLQKILQPEALSWEVQALDFWKNNPVPNDLDSGFRLWQRFRSAPFFSRIPGFSVLEMQKSYFRRLLEASPPPDGRLLTAGGLSMGRLRLMAGDPCGARRCLEEELSRCGEKPATRLRLAQANLQMGQEPAARVHFREALLQGWDRWDLEWIPDAELLRALKGADDPQWAVAEACIEGHLPIPRFQSRPEFCQSPIFRRLVADLEQPPPSQIEERQGQFHRCLAGSENRRWMEAELLIQVRLRMKQLHPRLHARYMKSLESKGR